MTPNRDALLLLDLQNAFFDEAGLAQHQDILEAAANRLSEAARAADVPVIIISTEHSRDESTWTLNMLSAGEGFLFHGDEGTQVIPGVNTEGATQMEKTRDSAFFGTDLDLRLKNLEVSRIVLAGVSTHGCIAQTTRDAYSHNLRVTLVTDAVADTDHGYHHSQLERLESDRQATLSTVDEILEHWKQA